MNEQDYNKDGGYSSRKFILSIVALAFLGIIAILSPIFGWEVVYLDSVGNSFMLIVLGYVGISSGRALIPRAVSHLAKSNSKGKKQTASVTISTGNAGSLDEI